MPNIQEILDKSRQELLDLSTRNRLLSIPISSKSARIIQIHDELSSQVMHSLVDETKTFTFLPGRKSEKENQLTDGEDNEDIGLPQPEDEADPKTRLQKRHVDSKLQTSLSSEGLQKRLLALYRDARTVIEEQGVNILYLSLGQLKWFEADQSDTPRYAPILLIPVELIRKSASDKFHVGWTHEDLEENLCLSTKLKTDFGIQMPAFPEEDSFDLSAYFQLVEKAVAGMTGWEILPNAITLGFFSFAKLLMYRDLDAANWPAADGLLKHPLITALLQDGFIATEHVLDQDAQVDQLISVDKLDHIVDSDSSQSMAIEMARRGQSLVIQGPPGTGKSQSITNIIATAALDGKKVLFVSEKMAALQV
ncbi:MAG TPA: DUF4011 domain-containing protein, partial [bacterium]|nr:DUF4011 domain-containing protein [bacterium]